MARKCFITHAWRDDREVEYQEQPDNAPAEYALIKDFLGIRYVPIDMIYFQEVEPWDDLL